MPEIIHYFYGISFAYLSLRMNRGKRVNAYAIVLIGFFSLFGCGFSAKEKISGSSSHPYFESVPFHLETQFIHGCDESLAFLNYVKETHLLGEKIDTIPRLKKAIEEIVFQKKIPTPYFKKNDENKTIGGKKFPYLVSYVDFSSSSLDESTIQKSLLQFQRLNQFCQTVDDLAYELSEHVAKNLSLKEITSLLHRGILKYFIQSLDPHSAFIEHPEQWYYDNELDFFLLKDWKYQIGISKENPYNHKNANVISAEWILNSSVLRIEMTKFVKESAVDFQKLYDSFSQQKEKVTALVIDLRRNGGGEANVVAELIDLFVKEGVILFRKARKEMAGEEDYIKKAKFGDELPVVSKKIPVIILVSRYSASSSETFTAGMQDHGAAIVIGEKTFGKGTAQIQFALSDPLLSLKSHSIFKLSSFYMYSPSGKPIQLQGITPDIEVIDKDFNYSDSNHQNYFERKYTHPLPMPDPIETSFQKRETYHLVWKEKLEHYFESLEHEFTLKALADFFQMW